MNILKGLGYLIVVVAVIFIGLAILGSDNNEVSETALSKKHCEISWATANDSLKRDILNEFIDNDGIDPVNGSFKTPGMLAAELLPKSVKYPNTLEIDNKSFEGWIYMDRGTIQNTSEGIVTFSKNFTAENKIGDRVKGYFTMTVKYNAGCKNFELIDFEVG